MAQDVLGVRVRSIRRRLGNALSELAWCFTLYNWGPDATRLAPRIRFATDEAQDQVAKIEAFTKAKTGGLIYRSQEPWVYEELGWPQPDWEEEAQREADAAQAAADAAFVRTQLFNPGAGAA